MSTTPDGGATGLAPGENLALLRKARCLTQKQLAQRANISLSLLAKIEVGDRTLTPAVAAVVGRAMGITMAEVMGKATVAETGAQSLTDLRAALRDYDVPGGTRLPEGQLGAEMALAHGFRKDVKVVQLLEALPGLLRNATTNALTANTDAAWAALCQVYSTVYWIAARYRWMDLAELAVARQRWAVEQRPTPLALAVAARDRAGTYLNFGDVERGLDVIDHAVSEAERALSGQARDTAVNVLTLRGMTLAGRLPDKKEARREAARHIRSAASSAEGLGSRDTWVLGLTVGPQNTVLHRLATYVDLGRPRDALELLDDLPAALEGLPATRVAPTYISVARAQLDIGDRDGALKHLGIAWDTAPQMARIHPMGREVFRVLSSLHRRANPTLTRMSKLSGIGL
ncbi:helix-turn-helix transcriptional regulator [Streptomyces sp. NPDC048057]|uniref:helix-turn-helix domain-containing protein n=1 Tax=Streptomyces sp. NPDC048057 TaxID=3155628 RepID=UPI0033EFF137